MSTLITSAVLAAAMLAGCGEKAGSDDDDDGGADGGGWDLGDSGDGGSGDGGSGDGGSGDGGSGDGGSGDGGSGDGGSGDGGSGDGGSGDGGSGDGGSGDGGSGDGGSGDGGSLPLGTRFADDADDWELPEIGDSTYGLFSASYFGSGYGSWSVFDIDGDGVVELVHMAAESNLVTHGWSSGDQYWEVYENTGSGFADTGAIWQLPEVGDSTYGLFAASYFGSGYGSWSVFDIDGDGVVELVHMAAEGTLTTHGWSSGDQYWRVYANTGSGFADSPTTWQLPEVGDSTYGLFAASYFGTSYGSWSVLDLDGDGVVELVHMAAESTLTTHGWSSGDQYWRVYANTGSGFANSPTTWDLPEVGDSTYGLFNASYFGSGYGSWSVFDIDGDELVELVHMAAESTLTTHGWSSGDQYWRVYGNTGRGFADSPSTWELPEVGDSTYGLFSASYFGSGYGSWSVFDLNGDGVVELVHMAAESDLVTHGWSAGDQYWQVYDNTGAGFDDTTLRVWDLPEVGDSTYGLFAASYFGGGYGSWQVLDITGDGRPELLHMAAESNLTTHGWSEGDQYWRLYTAE